MSNVAEEWAVDDVSVYSAGSYSFVGFAFVASTTSREASGLQPDFYVASPDVSDSVGSVLVIVRLVVHVVSLAVIDVEVVAAAVARL